MKTCSECEAQLALDQLVCLECEVVLETDAYSTLCLKACVAATLIHGAMVGVGLYPAFSIPETIILVSFLIAVIYPAIKLRQKQRDPDRPILAEVLSVYTDRSDRALFVVILLMCVGIPLGVGPEIPRTSANPAFATIRFWAMACGAAFFTVWILGSMIDQGLSFFDPRIPNTYVHRIRQQVQAD